MLVWYGLGVRRVEDDKMTQTEYIHEIFYKPTDRLIPAPQSITIFSLRDVSGNILYESKNESEVYGFAKGYYKSTAEELFMKTIKLEVTRYTEEYLNATILKSPQ